MRNINIYNIVLFQVGSNQSDSTRSLTPGSSTNSHHTSPRATPGFVSPINNSKGIFV